VITLLSVANPGSAQTKAAQDFGFYQGLGVLSLAGGAAAAALLWQKLQKGDA
jgi:hypothetical protein